MKILVVDNYDSFTFNLVHMLRELQVEVQVERNDKVDIGVIDQVDALVISPGPGVPEEAGKLSEVLAQCTGSIPMLGVCLGHQAIAAHEGAELINLEEVYHGVDSDVHVTADSALFQGLPRRFKVGRYHSWAVERKGLPPSIKETALDDQGCLMAFEIPEKYQFGIQFHPESVLTPDGKIIIQNFLRAIA